MAATPGGLGPAEFYDMVTSTGTGIEPHVPVQADSKPEISSRQPSRRSATSQYSKKSDEPHQTADPFQPDPTKKLDEIVLDDHHNEFSSSVPTPHGGGSQENLGKDNMLAGREKDVEHDDGESYGGDAAVRDLARTYSRNSVATHMLSNPFQADEGSFLDPSSDHFSARAWVRALVKLQDNEPDKVRRRTAGVAFRSLSAYGHGTETDYQKSVGNIAFQSIGYIRKAFNIGQRRIDILRNFDGLIRPGEMLVVLGPPGSGCSTFLKTLTGETHGYQVGKDSNINYQGISYNDMHKMYKGECIYTAEQDIHFPNLTVGDTLYFAARARAPRNIPGDVSQTVYAEHLRDVFMATFGIRHTINTKVGDDFIRGVSGGERKRVTIAEAALSGASLQCWDNSTRGLDSANAIEFCKTLRISSDLLKVAAAVAIYQAPQRVYDLFDKAVVLYEGRQIFFGPAKEAKAYFENIGFECPERQTTADFLTSMTSPLERVVRKGFEDRAPRTPDDFAEIWQNSSERQRLLQEIEEFDQRHPIGGEDQALFEESRALQKAKSQRKKSPFTLSFFQQIKLCTWRSFKLLQADPTFPISQIVGNMILGLITGSIFYNLPVDSGSFFSRGAILFYSTILNAFASSIEILILYNFRPMVEKHARYALYHPSADGLASQLVDLPLKIANDVVINTIIYFMSNLRRDAGHFFFFLLIGFAIHLTISMFFRSLAAVCRTLDQALVPAAIFIQIMVIYTGFVLPISYMHAWASWLRWVNPVSYGFESIVINEFAGREYPCSQYVPSGPGYGDAANSACAAQGSVAGQSSVSGTTYIATAFGYIPSHKWRNFGIMVAFLVGFLAFYLIAIDLIQAKKSKGEVLVFRRGHMPAQYKKQTPPDDESLDLHSPRPTNTLCQTISRDVPETIQRQTAIFQWRDVCFDIKIKKETRRILDHVDGWVEPGTLTALMGVSGAGKTTLLDVLATRATIGVVTGDMLVDGRQRDSSFQRKTGYVQQQDLHLDTSTVREALNFSALLRQPASVPRKEKLAYVDEVIRLLEMEEYADAVVGVPGEGLNVEQRKRLTIAVELAAKPQLLLFLDEPTSGLDSQTSWSILDLLEKLKNNGQAILCTIHQPSAVLFQRFDRLLFLAAGGKTVYFGPVGQDSETLTGYFERNGASPCPAEANPAEWMLEAIGAAPGSYTDIDWHQTWRDSPEYKAVHAKLDQMQYDRANMPSEALDNSDKAAYKEFAASFTEQWFEVQKRIFQCYWRTPSYIYSKLSLCVLVGLFIGFSFYKAPNTQQGLQNQLFGLFMLIVIFAQLVQQLLPVFISQRALYEARERPSKIYSWRTFMLSNIVVEMCWSVFAAALLYFCWYYPIGLYRNAEPTNAVTLRGAQMFLFIMALLLMSCSFGHFSMAGLPDIQTASNIMTLCFCLWLLFCGVLVTKTALPGFWIWMYYLSPFTYMIEGMLSIGVANTIVNCAANEFLQFSPPSGQTCGQYMTNYISSYGGYLSSNSSTTTCEFCRIEYTNNFLASINFTYAHVWRDFGILLGYIGFNVMGAVFFYWLARVPKNDGRSKSKKSKSGNKGGLFGGKREKNMSDSSTPGEDSSADTLPMQEREKERESS